MKRSFIANDSNVFSEKNLHELAVHSRNIIRRGASTLYSISPKDYNYFLLHHLWITVRRWFFFMSKPWHGVPHRRLARDKSLFFLQKLPKNSFFFAKLLIFKQNRCFSPKKSWTEWFSPFQGGPTALFVHPAGRLRREMRAIAILWDVWRLKNRDLWRINGISLLWRHKRSKIGQKSTYVGPNASKKYL